MPTALSGRSARGISSSWVKPCATKGGVTGIRPTGAYGQLRPLELRVVVVVVVVDRYFDRSGIFAYEGGLDHRGLTVNTN
eukprot:6484939-Amphidinium_carterae.2